MDELNLNYKTTHFRMLGWSSKKRQSQSRVKPWHMNPKKAFTRLTLDLAFSSSLTLGLSPE